MAKELKVNAEQWKALSDRDKGVIEGILLATKVIQPGDKIVGDPSMKGQAASSIEVVFSNPFCEIACEAAGAAAAAACSGLPPPADAICYAAAAEGVAQCKNGC